MSERAERAEALLEESLRHITAAVERANQLEAELRTTQRRLGEALTHAAQLQIDIEAEQRGALLLRQRFGALDTETFTAFVERLGREASQLEARRRSALEEAQDILHRGAVDHRTVMLAMVRIAAILASGPSPLPVEALTAAQLEDRQRELAELHRAELRRAP